MAQRERQTNLVTEYLKCVGKINDRMKLKPKIKRKNKKGEKHCLYKTERKLSDTMAANHHKI
jgi:hypothetical protein